jgi:hypothetical protein
VAEVEAGIRDDIAVSPASLYGAVLPGGAGDVVQGSVRLTVGPTAPSSPAVYDVWIDTGA